jgi:hypothetical protein
MCLRINLWPEYMVNVSNTPLRPSPLPCMGALQLQHSCIRVYKNASCRLCTEKLIGNYGELILKNLN